LYCAHSNFPSKPERSEILVLDTASMRLTPFKEFGNYGGSLTWAIRRGDHWYCNFARYGAENAETFLVQFDDAWSEVARWTYPSALIRRIGKASLSGGVWLGEDLLVTDHDNPRLYVLGVPDNERTVQVLAEQEAPITGQGIALDPLTGGLVGIDRAAKRIVFFERWAGGRDFLVLVLEFGPRRDVVRWANEVVAKHPRHEAILVTHAYMYNDDIRFDWAGRGKEQSWNPHSYPFADATHHDIKDGEQLWQNLVGRCGTFSLTFNGHVLGDGLGRTTTDDASGRPVNQMLVNFQMRPKGGDGWLRLVELKRGGAVEVCDYSPYRDQHNDSPQNRFQLRTSPVVS
jgi:hypothetical protein